METFNFNINISQKAMVFFGAIFLLIFLVGLSIAFGGSDPAAFGHTAGELQVNTSSGVMTLQQAINIGNVGGGIFTEKSTSPALPVPTTIFTPTIGEHGLSGEPLNVVVVMENTQLQAGYYPTERIILTYSTDWDSIGGPLFQVSFNATHVHVFADGQTWMLGKQAGVTNTVTGHWDIYITAYR